MTRRHNLFKFYPDRRWAEAFLEGELLFRSLAYFRDYEDAATRGDHLEGTAVFRPAGGLVVNNLTQGRNFILTGHTLVSRAKHEEIFVFCVSRSMTDEIRDRFDAVACVRVLNIPQFCARIGAALPPGAAFPGRPGHTRIGQRVKYYSETEGGSPRWALPDLIASSKIDRYAWQDEFRLVFSLTGALRFENVDVSVVPDDAAFPPNPAQHATYLVQAGSLRDICRIQEI